jgi:DNA gyrase/topoisomerase IV subunit B
MYLGGLGSTALKTLLLEVVSNAVDIVLAGRATRIAIVLDEAGWVTVRDNGPGFEDREGDTPAFVTKIFTSIHNTPTADGHTPHIHLSFGTGLCVISALSDAVTIESSNRTATLRGEFARGEILSAITEFPPLPETGTEIRFHPDPEIFGTSVFDLKDVRTDLLELAMQLRGAEIEFNGESLGLYPDLSALLSDLIRFGGSAATGRDTPEGRSTDAEFLFGGPIAYTKTVGQVSVSLAFGWIDAVGPPSYRNFCNLREVFEGYVFGNGRFDGFHEALGTGRTNRVYDLFHCVTSVLMLEPRWSGPTRRGLESPELRGIIADAMSSAVRQACRENPKLGAHLRRRIAYGPVDHN